MKYVTYLKNRNLSPKTIKIYLKEANKWCEFIKDRTPSKSLFVKYINQYSKDHQANSTRLVYTSVIQYLKFEKKWKLANQCRDIKLPKIQQQNKSVITLNEFNEIKSTINLDNKKEKRNWLIFSFLFLTGVRVCELIQFNKNDIFENNKIKIIGKGNKTRIVYLPAYLQELIKSIKTNRIALNIFNNKLLTNKQINIIIKKISIKFFNKEITPHGLRRSYATNLLRNNANIEIVRKTLGHSNINTTSRYLHFNDDEIVQELEAIYK